MNRKKEINLEKNSNFSSSKFISDNEFIKLKDTIERLKSKYKISSSEILNQIDKKEILIPCEIFNEKLSGLEIICKYLKENLNLATKEISSLLNRDEKTIWQAYDSSKKKYPDKIITEFSKYYLPISIFVNRDYAILESIVKYLRENYNLSYHEIAVLLKRNDRTIWTVYQRSLKKNSKKLKEENVR